MLEGRESLEQETLRRRGQVNRDASRPSAHYSPLILHFKIPISPDTEHSFALSNLRNQRETRQSPSPPRQEGACGESIQDLTAVRGASAHLFISLVRASRSPPLMPAMYFTSLFLASMSYWLVMAICSMTGEPPPW